MAKTPIDLYRAGNGTSARLNVLRPGEVITYFKNGVEYVTARSGGISTFAAPMGLRGKWWRLPAGTQYDEKVLCLVNDYGDHWSWEPADDVPVSVYAAALAAVNVKFI